MSAATPGPPAASARASPERLPARDTVAAVIVVVAGLKGGVGKTTTSVYLSALAANGRRSVTLIDADPQASAAEWVEVSDDERLGKLTVVEGPEFDLGALVKEIELAPVPDKA